MAERDASPRPLAHSGASGHLLIGSSQSSCCIAGGGPAGMMLAYLLARRGISVTLLEAHNDFDRAFRGDTVHPSTLEILDSLGLAERLLELPHTKVHSVTIRTSRAAYTMADFGRLKSRYPYIALIPQEKFLDFLAAEAAQFPAFRLIMGANVKDLVECDGRVEGVCYQSHEGWHEVRSALTVAADGRFSKLRALAGLEPVKTSPPMDVLWTRLPRKPEDDASSGASFYIKQGRFLVAFVRPDHWQLGYVIPKGSYQALRSEGLASLRSGIAGLLPMFSDRVEELQSWNQVAPLSVESSRLRQWSIPGLLLIGDAAHAMSPVGGVGINYAVQDAVVAANVLAVPLKAGYVDGTDLAEVQRRRELPTQVIQAFQALVQKQILRPALDPRQEFVPPAIVQIPVLRDLIVRLIAYGLRRVRVEA